MAVDKDDIVRRLGEIAIFLELNGASPYEVLAFRNGADSLREWEGDLQCAVAAGTLTEIHGIGKGIAGVIEEFARHGHSQKYENVRGNYPATVLELFDVPGLGLKKIKQLHAELGIDSLAKLEHAATSGAVRGLSGFGAKTEAGIIRGIGWARRPRSQ